MTRAQEIWEKVEALVAGGMERPDAFRKLAEELGIRYDSVRGSYYTYKKSAEGGGGSRPRRRETTPDDAIAQARVALERAIESIDREVAAADERAREARAEFEAMKKSAPERKEAIQARLTALE
jgi:flagellar motility protein MotE (MotC chaperone)